MQQSESPDQWQQPEQSQSGAPYEAIQADDDSPSAQYTEEPQGNEPTYDEQDDDDAVLRWEGPEYVSHDRDKLWYLVFGIITLALMALSIFLIQSITFTVLIPVMAAALFVYTRRAPQDVSYVVSRKGVHVNDKLHPYDTLRAFSITTHGGAHSLVLVPRKRFQMAVTAFFPEEVGESLVDMLAARLPMQTYTPDLLDKLLTKFHI